MAAERKVPLVDVSSNDDIETQANPMPESSSLSNARFLSDRRHLLNVFPEEVWDVVFKKAENPKGLECLSNSSLFLRDLLAPQRVQFLFPTVLEIMGENDPVDKNPISWLIESDIFPLKLRAVCQYWNKTIDNMIDNHPFHFYLLKDARTELNARFQYNFIKSYIVNHLFSPRSDRHVLLLSHFYPSHGNVDRNPFLGRSIVIKFYTNEEEEIMANFVPAVRTILRKYGFHIFYFRVIATGAPLSNSQLYLLIREFLQLMPNLKAFKYIGNILSGGFELYELRDHVNCNPLPTLQNLQMLATDELDIPIVHELIRSNGNNIATLDISNISMSTYAMPSLPLPFLTTFSMNLTYEEDICHLNDSRLTWPLTRLFLNMKDLTFTSWEPVFNVVNNFAATLTHLQLELPHLEGAEDQEQVMELDAHLRLNLPHLRNLSIGMPYVTCLDFLLPPTDSLLVFDVSIDLSQTVQIRGLELMEKVETGQGKIIKLLSCRRGASESNLWKLFPNLTQVKYTLKTKPSNHETDIMDSKELEAFTIYFDDGEREILERSCSRQEWIKGANLSTL